MYTWMKKISLILLLTLFSILLPDNAIAAGCDASGNPSGFDSGSPFTPPVDPSTCNLYEVTINGTDVDFDLKLISGAICLVQSIFTRAGLQVYCGMFVAMQPVLFLCIVLYIMFYGLAAAMQMENADGRDIVWRILKLTLIAWLVTDADAFYFWMYQSFFEFLNGYSAMMIETQDDLPGGKVINLADGQGAMDNQGNLAGYLDELFEGVVGTEKILIYGLLGLLFLVLGFGAPITLLLIGSVVSAIYGFFYVCIAYITAILALTYLLMFAPMFLTFALFSRTFKMFEGWLASLISYTLQPMLIIGFLFVIGAITSPQLFMEKLLELIISIDFGDHTINIVSDKLKLLNLPKVSVQIIGVVTAVENIITPAVTFLIIVITYLLTFIFLDTIMGDFSKKAPEIAQQLARWQKYSAPRLSGESASISDLGGGSVREGASSMRPEGQGVSHIGGMVTGAGNITGVGPMLRRTVQTARESAYASRRPQRIRGSLLGSIRNPLGGLRRLGGIATGKEGIFRRK